MLKVACTMVSALFFCQFMLAFVNDSDTDLKIQEVDIADADLRPRAADNPWPLNAYSSKLWRRASDLAFQPLRISMTLPPLFLSFSAC